MKKCLTALAVIILISCGGGDAENKGAGEPKPGTEATKSNSGNPEYEKGLDLATQYQCFSCHKIDEKLTGPSYKEIAAKYAGADDAKITELAKKVIAGGSGVWGEQIMTPNPNVNEDDAKAMVKYILLLNK